MDNRSLLIVDDDTNVAKSLERELRREGYMIYTAHSGRSGLECLETRDIGVVLSDQKMPEMDGLSFLEKVREMKPDVVRLLLTGHGSMESAMDAINRSGVFSYLTKPWSFEAMKDILESAFQQYNLVTENRRLHKLVEDQNRNLSMANHNLDALVHERTQQLEEAIREGILMLALASEAKDDDTGKHVYRIQGLTAKICRAMGLPEKRVEEISFFSTMHDVGKVRIPDHILKKPGPLTKEEWSVMKTHATAGEEILGNKPYYQTAREIARSHHERWDGTGYPDGLKGAQIPLSARIVTYADIFDALTHNRPYKKAWSRGEAVATMKSLKGEVLDPEIMAGFLQSVAEERA